MNVDITNILKKHSMLDPIPVAISKLLISSSGKPTVLYCDYKAVLRLCMPNYLRGPK